LTTFLYPTAVHSCFCVSNHHASINPNSSDVAFSCGGAMRSFLCTTNSPCLDRSLCFSSAAPATNLASFPCRFRRRFCLELLVGAGDYLGFDLVVGLTDLEFYSRRLLHAGGCGLRRCWFPQEQCNLIVVVINMWLCYVI